MMSGIQVEDDAERRFQGCQLPMELCLNEE
jgi:hypothetical protein